MTSASRSGPARRPLAAAGVLFLVENNAYPFDVRVRREAHALRDAGYSVFVIAPRAGEQPWSETIDGVLVYRFPRPPQGRGLFGYALEFGYATLAMLVLAVWVCLSRGVDVIHAANPPDTLFVIGALLKPFGKRFVFDHHDLAPETYLSRFGRSGENLVTRALYVLERGSFAVADVVIATNESYRRRALHRGRKRFDQVFVVRNGPPLSFRAVSPDPLLAGRASHLVGYIGTMGPQDGVDYWLRAIKEMVFTIGRRDFLAVLIGDGDAAADLRALTNELEIERYVWFTGRIPDEEATRYLSTMTVCVHPDPLNPLNNSSTMNKMMEYMALGKATVAFDLEETRYSAGDAALYVTPNDELQFAERVCWLLDHPVERQAMAAEGLKRVRDELAWEYSKPSLLRAYRQLIAASPSDHATQGVNCK